MRTDLVNELVELRRDYPTTDYFLEEIRAQIWMYAEDLVKRTIKELESPLEDVWTGSGVVCIWDDSDRPSGEGLDDCVGLGFLLLEDVRDGMNADDWVYSHKKHKDGSVDDFAAMDNTTISAWLADLRHWLRQKPENIIGREISADLKRQSNFYRAHQDEGPATE